MTARKARGAAAHRAGLDAEALARAALEAEGWTILGQRLRTPAGEIDIAAEREGVLVLVEVKRRATLAAAAEAITSRQAARLSEAGEALLAAHPEWGANGVRFDVFVVDRAGSMRRVMDALRLA